MFWRRQRQTRRVAALSDISATASATSSNSSKRRWRNPSRTSTASTSNPPTSSPPPCSPPSSPPPSPCVWMRYRTSSRRVPGVTAWWSVRCWCVGCGVRGCTASPQRAATCRSSGPPPPRRSGWHCDGTGARSGTVSWRDTTRTPPRPPTSSRTLSLLEYCETGCGVKHRGNGCCCSVCWTICSTPMSQTIPSSLSTPTTTSPTFTAGCVVAFRSSSTGCANVPRTTSTRSVASWPRSPPSASPWGCGASTPGSWWSRMWSASPSGSSTPTPRNAQPSAPSSKRSIVARPPASCSASSNAQPPPCPSSRRIWGSDGRHGSNRSTWRQQRRRSGQRRRTR
mmetsp:Transcript_74455/g.174754  ORF Transcript_74455/g.174754 Transcript_74455/m.174754 type:complete len:339 (+) Transcript_74455:43-1059(+)